MNTEFTIIKGLGLTPGDTVISPKSSFEVVQHYALYLGQDYGGNHYMCENAYGKGVKLTRVQDYFTEYTKLTSIKRFTGNHQERINAVQYALTRLGRSYDLINYNCEHFVNDVLFKKPSSKQVANVLVVLGFAFIVKLLVSE